MMIYKLLLIIMNHNKYLNYFYWKNLHTIIVLLITKTFNVKNWRRIITIEKIKNNISKLILNYCHSL